MRSPKKPVSRWADLFDGRAADDRHANACVNYLGDPSPIYASGYLDAARWLATHVCESHQDQDRLVYPILFALRHYLELSFKYAIWLARVYQQEGATWPADGHRLAWMWNTLKTEYARVYERLPDDATGRIYVQRIDECVKAISEVDPNGEDFRYAYRKDLTRAMESKRHVSLSLLLSELDPLDEAVSGLTYMLGEAADYAAEARSEMRSNYEA